MKIRKFWRWLIGAGDDFCFDREFARLIAATPAAELRKHTRSSEEARWPRRPSTLTPRLAVLRADLDTKGPAARKPKAPKRIANARPAAKSKNHKGRS